MRHILVLAAAVAALSQFPVKAQDTGESTDVPAGAEGTAPDQAETQAQEPVPELTGTATGSLAGTRINVPVTCEGFDQGDMVTARSDPAGEAGSDANNDGVLVDVSASRSTGSINYSLLAGGMSMSMADGGAEVNGNVVRYSITMSFVGGGEESIDLTINCE